MDTPLSDAFVSELMETFGNEQAKALVQALDSEPVVGVRYNPRKPTDIPQDATRVAWCADGYIMPYRPQFTLMPLWHAGCFYVQEPSSMIIYEVVKRLIYMIGRDDIRYLDMCAAPGGKTTAALSALEQEAFVVANEFVPSRANILVENLTKWGYPNVAVSCGDTAAYRNMPETFDIVAVDAPCSGEGMMRKDEQARKQWSPALVAQCAELQREILCNAWATLRQGGYLIYSTCTFNRHEDEDMVQYAIDELGAECIDLGITHEYGIPGSIDTKLHALRFMPHITCGEGIFMCVLRKPGEGVNASVQKEKNKGKRTGGSKSHSKPKELETVLSESDNFEYHQDKSGAWYAVSKPYDALIAQLEKHTKLLMRGVMLGETKGKAFVPDTALALSVALNSSAYPRVCVDEATALSYLRREALTLSPDTPKGYVILTFEGHTLGFAKNLGNRANNLYPQHWRIRHL